MTCKEQSDLEKTARMQSYVFLRGNPKPDLPSSAGTPPLTFLVKPPTATRTCDERHASMQHWPRRLEQSHHWSRDQGQLRIPVIGCRKRFVCQLPASRAGVGFTSSDRHGNCGCSTSSHAELGGGTALPFNYRFHGTTQE